MEAIASACHDVFQQAAKRITPLHGGDLSEVARVTLFDGREVVAKQGKLADREARMLNAIAATGMPAPKVMGVVPGVMFLEALDEARPSLSHWARFGESLARMHASPGPDAGHGYGWPEDYAFGPVVIANAQGNDWPRFWAEQRLAPFLPALPRPLATRLDALVCRLPELLPKTPSAGLLHGDLWSGNLLPTATAIHLIDPASYHGHGEVDLAMLHLFGGPGPGFWEGYGTLAPGWERRRAIYSLFPALVHFRLFGAGYQSMVARFLAAAGV